ncbi:MAG: ComEC/Rec2 family competence protein [Rhodoblastus sp.]
MAIFGAIAYDVSWGSRVGAERALVMTCIMLLAAVFDRPSVSMRNLALAVVFVVAVEPEALMGASFQLSFAAVAALVAVWEARLAAQARARAAARKRAARAAWQMDGVDFAVALAWARRRALRRDLRDVGHRLVHGRQFPRTFAATC